MKKKCCRCQVLKERSRFCNKNSEEFKQCNKCRRKNKKARENAKLGIIPERTKLQTLRKEALIKGHYICSKCKKELPFSKFGSGSNPPKTCDGLNCICKDCRRPMYKYSKLKKRLGLSESDIINMFNSQEGKCKICSSPILLSGKVEQRNSIMCTDHCHKSGVVRGLLCNSCNRGLGFFRDDSNILLKAYNYITTNGKSIE